MATGSITSLGIGSGLDLQDIIDQLKGVDETRITAKQEEQAELQTQVDGYDTVNAKLFSIKSDALNLSLASNFLANSVSISDEDILSATVGDGYEASSYSLEVTQKAQRNSWASTAAAGKTDALFSEPESGISDTDTTAVITLEAGVLTEDVTLGTDTLLGAGSTIASGSTLAAGTFVTTDIETASGTVTAGTTLSEDTVIIADVTLAEDMTLVSNDTNQSILIAGSENDRAPLSIYYGADGDQEQIDITLDGGMTLEDIVDAVNNSEDNADEDGNQLVTASIAANDNGEYYMRISATSGGGTQDSQVSLSHKYDWVAADTTVGITQGDSTMYLSVAPGTTYQKMAELINNAEDNPGITAAIINNGDTDNPYQLTLTADDTGEEARITLSNFDELTEVNGAGGESLNAEFTVDGIAYSRQSNSGIDDVIAGVTFELKRVGETTLDIEVSRDTVKEDLLSMIEGFNDLVSYINGTDEASSDTESETEDDTDNPFDGSSSAGRILSQLKALLTTRIDVDSAYTSLIDLGLEIAKDGTISIDENTLDEAIANDPDALKTLFLGDEDEEITGLADVINDALSEMVSSTGIASTEIDEAEAKIDRLDESIDNETERLTKKYEIMSAQFLQLDTYISQLNSEAALMTSLFDSFGSSSDD